MFGCDPLRHTRLGERSASGAPCCHELCDHHAASLISSGTDLVKEPGGIMAAFVPALMEVVGEIRNLLSTTTGRFTLWKFAAAQPAANGLALDVEFSADSC